MAQPDAGATPLWVALDWIEAHCVVPDGDHVGEPFALTTEQARFLAHHYLVKPSATLGQEAPAFVYRRSQLVRPQKWGKGPLTAAQICLEAVGPALFAGWATGGEIWDCRDHDCGCGWTYSYRPGEAMGRPWPTPLIQVTAVAEDQASNIYDALIPMIQRGPLDEVVPKVGVDFARLPGGGRIETVTSSARTRLGQRVTFVPQDETGLWLRSNGMVAVAQTQRRGAAGMGGRVVETTNAWDPGEQSVARMTAESKSLDIYRDHVLPPAGLAYKNKRDRRKIHRIVYGDSWWVDLDSIEAEAAELMDTDPGQAERFFGNRVTAGAGAAFDIDTWTALARPDGAPESRSLITIGVDGARSDDALAVIATDVATGWQWPLGIWERPPDADDFYEHDLSEVDDIVTDAMAEYRVWRMYCDPQFIETLIDRWLGRWGPKKVINWYTSRPRQMAHAVRSYRQAMTTGEVTHSGDSTFSGHIANARRRATNVYDEDKRPMTTIAKESRSSAKKIDAAVAAILAWEARGDAIAAGALKASSKPRLSAFV